MSDDASGTTDDDAPGATDDDASSTTDDAAPAFEAARYPDGAITYPFHPVGPGGGAPVDTVDLSEYTAEVITWTTSNATPPGVREPNHVAIVEFDVDGESVRAIGQATTGDIDIGDEVEPVYCEQLRDPEAGIREPESQEWDGFQFRPTE